ncbi:MAG: LuxR C-terminal-related transcriptional regulator [Pseudomonadota bacterium]
MDPQPLWVAAITRILTEAEITVVEAVTTPQGVLDALERHRPDLFVVEPAGGGSTLLADARALLPDLRIVAIAASADPEHVDQALAAGAVAYVIKTAQPIDIRAGIRQAFRSSIFLPSPRRAQAPAETGRAVSGVLTPRELEILKLAAAGRPNAELARMLWVTEQTVKFHLSSIYRKLGVANRTEASRWAQVNGLLDDEDAGAARPGSA